jgi:hypothetical protein
MHFLQANLKVFSGSCPAALPPGKKGSLKSCLLGADSLFGGGVDGRRTFSVLRFEPLIPAHC